MLLAVRRHLAALDSDARHRCEIGMLAMLRVDVDHAVLSMCPAVRRGLDVFNLEGRLHGARSM